MSFLHILFSLTELFFVVLFVYILPIEFASSKNYVQIIARPSHYNNGIGIEGDDDMRRKLNPTTRCDNEHKEQLQ